MLGSTKVLHVELGLEVTRRRGGGAYHAEAHTAYPLLRPREASLASFLKRLHNVQYRKTVLLSPQTYSYKKDA